LELNDLNDVERVTGQGSAEDHVRRDVAGVVDEAELGQGRNGDVTDGGGELQMRLRQ
jgi:hypothetical protein